MKPEKTLTITVAQGLLDYFKIFENPHASHADMTKALSKAAIVLSEAFGILSTTVDDKGADEFSDAVKEYSLAFRKERLKEIKKAREGKDVH